MTNQYCGITHNPQKFNARFFGRLTCDWEIISSATQANLKWYFRNQQALIWFKPFLLPYCYALMFHAQPLPAIVNLSLFFILKFLKLRCVTRYTKSQFLLFFYTTVTVAITTYKPTLLHSHLIEPSWKPFSAALVNLHLV